MLPLSFPASVEVGGAAWSCCPSLPSLSQCGCCGHQGASCSADGAVLTELGRATQLWKKAAHFGGLLERGAALWAFGPISCPFKAKVGAAGAL